MIITLIPRGQSRDEPNPLDALTLERQGQTLVINGDPFDFSVISHGATLPDGVGATGCAYIIGDIERDEIGKLHIALVLPHADGNNASHEARFPQPIIVTHDGPIALPDTAWPPQFEIPAFESEQHNGAVYEQD
ncbi:MAG: hypothetical protein ABN482_09740 [Corticimicrobacter sp.]|uniref:hypothetical protein n=1 Tax=Corticimicrobacter sp. TaxID=2678536 RepID=UPI0032DAFEA6